MLQFCPVCKKLLSIKEVDGNIIGYCSCGFKRVSGIDLSYSEIKKDDIFKGEGVINTEDNKTNFLHTCKKCGNNNAEIFEGGERLSNESNLYLVKCLNCGHMERKSNSI